MECPPVLSSCSLFLALKHPDDCSEKAQLKSPQQDFTSITERRHSGYIHLLYTDYDGISE